MIHPIVNSVVRRVDHLFGRVGASTKHNHYIDFGWPKDLTFEHFKRMYDRNSLAAAAVDKTTAKTWETSPKLWESEKAADSALEKSVEDHFAKIKLWRGLMTTDRRSMVGRYAAVILLLGDGQKFDKEVVSVPGGLEGLVGVIPVWENQLRVVQTVTDNQNPDYGRPLMFEYQEISDVQGVASRSVRVHASRVIVWSEDGLLDGASILQPGYNDLLDAEKVRGAGGEGFWKTSRGAPIIQAPEGLKPSDVAKNMGIEQTKLIDKVNEQLELFQQGFDKGLLLGGMTATPMTISLPQPEQFHNIPVCCFAASVQMPVRILVGNQTGERASTEDAREWAKVNMARRSNLAVPCIRQFIERLVAFGILPEKDWTVGWDDLTEATATEKVARATSLSDINSKVPATEMPVFTPEEIREAAGYKPLIEVDPEFVAEFEDSSDDTELGYNDLDVDPNAPPQGGGNDQIRPR